MLVICNGMPRSASTWSFNVVLALLRCSQPSCEVYGGYDEDIARFLETLPSAAEHAVVKCHGLDARGRTLAQADSTKILYTWRDPADAVVSCMRMFNYDFEHALAAVDSSLTLYDFHSQSGAALILDYQLIVSDTIEAVRRIAAFLGLDDSSDTVRAVTEQTSLERVREKVESLADNARMVHRAGLVYDPETLLHRGHIRDGGVGYGRKALTAWQSDQIDELLRRHGLPPT
jgi:Sulfotransferase domain